MLTSIYFSFHCRWHSKAAFFPVYWTPVDQKKDYIGVRYTLPSWMVTYACTVYRFWAEKWLKCGCRNFSNGPAMRCCITLEFNWCTKVTSESHIILCTKTRFKYTSLQRWLVFIYYVSHYVLNAVPSKWRIMYVHIMTKY